MKTFEQFRREIADAVTVAINSGVRITDERGSPYLRCPLGVRSLCSTHPSALLSSRTWDIGVKDAADFACAFDGKEVRAGEYAALGRLYRQRFVEGK